MLNKITKEDLSKPKTNQPAAEVRDAVPDERENDYDFSDIKESLTDQEIEILFPYQALYHVKWFKPDEKDEAYKRIKVVFNKLHLHSLASYTYIKGLKAYTYRATPEAPIFVINEGKYKIIYQPMAEDPADRYIYAGERPEHFLHGIAQLKAEKERRAKKTLENQVILDNDPEHKFDYEDLGDIKEVILVPEPAAAFGLALMGFFTCYITGSQMELTSFDLNEHINKNCKKLYQLVDTDEASKKRAHVNSLEHLGIFNMELPITVKVKTDIAQQQYKLIRNINDFLKWQNKYEVEQLMSQALPYLFWDMEPVYGGPKDKRVKIGEKYDFKSTQSYNFLNKMGFFRLAVEGRKTEYIYILKDGNIIRERTPNKVKNYIHEFLKERKMATELRDTMYESTRLNEASLSNLDETTINFNYNDEKSQFLFFENGTLEVQADKLKLHDQGSLDRFVWEKDVIKHSFLQQESPFTITRNPEGVYDIVINHYDCSFFNMMIQTSRIHWRRELEIELPLKYKSKPEQDKYLEDHRFEIDSELLTQEERYEQKQHLINKIFAYGYIIHQYKSRSKSWAVVGTDDKLSHNDKSNGGTGKSMLFNQSLSYVFSPKSIHKIPGTNPAITQNPHIFHGLDKDKKALIVDDADKNLSFRFFFEFITGDQVVNNKNGDIFSIPFAELCKMIWLTNFSFNTDTSTERRILYFVCSDYYHQANAVTDYKETREPRNEFKKDLFTQFTPEEFNAFYNTVAYCTQFFIGCPDKIDPPMSSVTKRKLLREMGVEFEGWASLYFHEESGNTNKLIVKAEAMAEFIKQFPKYKDISSNWFKKAVEAYCRYNSIGFNPPELWNDKNDRIVAYLPVRTMNREGEWISSNKKTTLELLYIQTNFDMELNRTNPGDEPFTPKQQA